MPSHFTTRLNKLHLFHPISHIKDIVQVATAKLVKSQMSNEKLFGRSLAELFRTIDREFVTSAKKNSRILTNFPKLKKIVKIRTKIR